VRVEELSVEVPEDVEAGGSRRSLVPISFNRPSTSFFCFLPSDLSLFLFFFLVDFQPFFLFSGCQNRAGSCPLIAHLFLPERQYGTVQQQQQHNDQQKGRLTRIDACVVIHFRFLKVRRLHSRRAFCFIIFFFQHLYVH
jgi:hypothetical protein